MLYLNFTGDRRDPASGRPFDDKLWLAQGKKTFMLSVLNDSFAASTVSRDQQTEQAYYA